MFGIGVRTNIAFMGCAILPHCGREELSVILQTFLISLVASFILCLGGIDSTCFFPDNCPRNAIFALL